MPKWRLTVRRKIDYLHPQTNRFHEPPLAQPAGVLRFGVVMSHEAQREPSSRADPPWRRWYRTARWKRLRQDVFLRDLYQCRMCGDVISQPIERVCDHIEPHGGDERRFWDPGNLQTLCKACHDGEKQRQEQPKRERRGVWD